MASRLDPRDHELLQRVAGGERVFKPTRGEATDAPAWIEVVERLRRPPGSRVHPNAGATAVLRPARLPAGGAM